MSNATQPYKRSLTGSVGAGMGSLFNGKDRTYFILEHKVSSKFHKAGEAQEIIVDQIELGRDSSCAVRFDESFSTVSRRHAAIVRDGDNWKLVQLSTVNTTFLNGHPVQKEWYLQNGDEIQLSVNGPKLGFIIPTGNKASVASIGLSRRLSLFRQQALKPYKTALVAMGIVIILLICGGVGYGVWDYKRDCKLAEINKTEIEKARKEGEEALKAANANTEELRQQLASVEKNYSDLKKRLSGLSSSTSGRRHGQIVVSPSDNTNEIIKACEPYIYYVSMAKIELTYDGETYVMEDVGSGTGFLLDDGRFITARHVVEPWSYISSEDDTLSLAMNLVANNGGSVKCYLEAYSPSGKRLSLVSTNAKINRSSDETVTCEAGNLCIASDISLDYAIFNTNSGSKGLEFNDDLSTSLPVQAQLMALGFPLGLGAYSSGDIHPLYSEAVVAKEGLDHGLILTTASTFEQGNSGGPVFAITNDDKPLVIGIVRGGGGRSTGIVVPIANIK